MQVPAPFDYERATSVDHALELLQRLGPEARILAGGHSLLPMMKLRLAAPEFLVDINELAGELGYIREGEGGLHIGSMTRHRELLESELIAARLPIFTDAEKVIADPVVRNRGTIGGALCQADPAEDLSGVCAALKAQAVIRGPGGERVDRDGRVLSRPLRDRRRGRRDADRGSRAAPRRRRQRLREGRAPRGRLGRGGGRRRGAARRRHDRRRRHRVDRGRRRRAPRSARRTRSAGQAPSDELFATAAASAAEDCSPTADQRGTVEYKRHLAQELTHRALRRAVARALGGEA